MNNSTTQFGAVDEGLTSGDQTPAVYFHAAYLMLELFTLLFSKINENTMGFFIDDNMCVRKFVLQLYQNNYIIAWVCLLCI